MKRHRLEQRVDDSGETTYWSVDPESGVGYKILLETAGGVVACKKHER